MSSSFFNIEKEEVRTAGLLFLQCMCVVASAFVIGRAIANALFLQRVDNRWLAYAYVVSAVAVSSASAVYAHFAGRIRSDRLVVATSLVFATTVLVTRLVLPLASESILLLGFVYVLFDIVGDISMMQVWTLAGDLFTARQAKRLFAVVGAGGAVAGVVFGGLLNFSVRLLGTENQLFLSAALLLCVGLIARALGKGNARALEARPSTIAGAPRGLVADLTRVGRSKYLIGVASLIAVVTMVSVLVDYQWKLAANAAYAGDEDGLTGYFGLFFLVTNGAALVVQVFVAGRLLERFGIRAGLSMLPVVLVGGTFALLLAPTAALALWGGTLAKGADGTFRYSIHNASAEMLYRPLGSFRPRAKAILDGIAKPVFAALAGLLIATLTTWAEPRQLGIVTLCLLAAWLVLVGIVHRDYVASLAARLRSRRAITADPATLDRATIEALEQALSSDDQRRAANALELLEGFPTAGWEPPVDKLLGSEDLALRRRAVVYIARHGGPAVAALAPFLHAEDPDLCGAAIAAHLNHGDDVQRANCQSRLTAMTRAPETALRLAAARAMASMSTVPLDDLLTLLRDRDPEVRLEAIKAVTPTVATSDEVVAVLLEALNHPQTRHVASEALLARGTLMLAKLDPLLEPLVPRRTQVAVVSILERLAAPEATARLEAAMDHARERTRHAAVAARCRLARSRPRPEAQPLLEARLEAELRAYYQAAVTDAELGRVQPLLLGDARVQQRRRCAERILHLVSALYPRTDFQLVHAALASPKAWLRGHALELLDNTVAGRHREWVLPVFDDAGPQRPEAMADGFFSDLQHRARTAWLEELCHDEDPWVAATAIYEGAVTDVAPSTYESLLTHPHPVVRETAEAAVAERFETESPMIPIVERVLFLKRVDIFADIPGDLLLRVAELAQEVAFERDETIITAGAAGDCMYTIVSGSVRVMILGARVTELHETESFGEMSLLDSEPRSATVIAEGNVLTLRLDQAPFFELLAERSELSRRIISVQTRRLREMLNAHAKRKTI